MNFNFGEILTRAWQITWKYKVLWIFGILAGCTQGGGGNGGGSSGGGSSSWSSDFDVPPELKQFAYQMENFGEWFVRNWWIFIIIGIVGLLFAALFIFLGTIGRIGLIKGTYKAEMGAETLSFGELFSSSLPYFWRVFGLSFLIGLAILLLMVPFVVLGILTAGIAFLCILPLLCLLIPVGMVVGLVIEQSNRAIVLEDLPMFGGLRRGWDVVRANIGPMIIMALILFGLQLVIGILIALPIFIIVFPSIFAFVLGQAQSFTPLYVALACMCLYAPISWILSGVLTTYTQSAWTLTYMQLTKKSEPLETPVFSEPDA